VLKAPPEDYHRIIGKDKSDKFARDLNRIRNR